MPIDRRRVVRSLIAEAGARQRLAMVLDAIVHDVLVTGDVERDCADPVALERLVVTTIRQASDDALAALADGLDDAIATGATPRPERIAIGRRRRELGWD
jgi:hypothetical protein